jgi:hypothetical protein
MLAAGYGKRTICCIKIFLKKNFVAGKKLKAKKIKKPS